MNFPFDPKNPFPLVESFEGYYFEAKNHSEEVDAHFEFRVSEIEANIKSSYPHAWIGLDPQALLTPYIEIRYMLSKLRVKEGDVICDLGAAYGRMGLVIAKHFKDLEFVGVECVKERAEEGRRILEKFASENTRMICADILSADFEIPEAQVYFVYDFSSNKADIKKLLEKLKVIARDRMITIVGRGRATRDQIEKNEPWLTDIRKPQHFGNFSIFRS